jgi:dGTPase
MLGLIPYKQAFALLEGVVGKRDAPRPTEQLQPENRLGVLRSAAIGALIHECVGVFAEAVEQMEQGQWEQSLVSARAAMDRQLEKIKRLTRQRGYESERVLQIESAGFKTLGGLLEMFASAVVTDTPNKEEKKLRQLLPLEFLQRPGAPLPERGEALALLSPYQRLLCVTDYISGMTDGFAVELFQRLSGIKLPS